MAATTSYEYITPIMDRTYEDVMYAYEHQNDLVNKHKGAWNYTDCNRVCNNLLYAAQWMYEQEFFPEPLSFNIKTDWRETDIITSEQLQNMILDPLMQMYAVSRPDLEWRSVGSLSNMTFMTANDLEYDIDLLAHQLPMPPEQYELTVEDGTGSGHYVGRTIVNITANPAPEGQVFSHWEGDHLENLGDRESPTTTYEMPYEDVVLYARYTDAIPHAFTLTTHSGTMTQNLYMGTSIDIEADPAPNDKVFYKWIIEPEEYEEYLHENTATTTFIMPNDAVSLTAFYITKGNKHLKIINGTITASGSNEGYYPYDTYVAIQSNKPEGATFTGWSGNYTQYLTQPASEEFNSVRIPDLNYIELRANWSIPPVQVELYVQNGYITSTGSQSGTFNSGTSVSITGYVGEGRTFTGWSVGSGSVQWLGGGVNGTVTLSDSDVTVVGNTRELVYCTLETDIKGVVSSRLVEAGARFSIEANPPPANYVFDHWEGYTDGSQSSDVAGIDIWAPSTGATMGYNYRRIKAVYRKIETLYTLTVVNGYANTSDTTTYTATELSTIGVHAVNPATAAPRYRFAGWTLSGKGSLANSGSENTIFTFGNGDATITANYVPQWEITVAGRGRFSDGSTTKWCDQNGSYEVYVSLAAYEGFQGWTHSLDGLDRAGSFSNIAATRTYFRVGSVGETLTPHILDYGYRTLTIRQRNPETGTVSLVSTTTHRYGDRPIIVAPIAPDTYTFSAWLGSDNSHNEDLNLLENALSSTAIFKSAGITKNMDILATYFQPGDPVKYNLTVWYGSPQSGNYEVGQQITVRADQAGTGYVFYKWYGDTMYLVDSSDAGRRRATNSVIIPQRDVVLSAKYAGYGKYPLFRIVVTNGKASATYYEDMPPTEGEDHRTLTTVNGSDVLVPPDVPVTLTADPDTQDYEFWRWSGDYEEKGVNDLYPYNRETVFTMVENDLNIQIERHEKQKYVVTVVDGRPIGSVTSGTYQLNGAKDGTDEIEYVFREWTCEDDDGNDCISAIGNPTLQNTTITVVDKNLTATAWFTPYYKLTVIQGQNSDPNLHFYAEGTTITTVEANTPPEGQMFDYWIDPLGIIDTVHSSITDKTPIIIMPDHAATITATFTSTTTNDNSIVIAGTTLHSPDNNILYRRDTTLVSGIYAVGTIVFDRDGCIGTITETDPDHNDNTDDYKCNRLFYGGNI